MGFSRGDGLRKAISDLKSAFDDGGGYMYTIEVRHKKLNKYRVIRGSESYIVEQKALAQEAAWNEQWARKKQLLEQRESREQALRSKQGKIADAEEMTEAAEKSISELENLLTHTIAVDDKISWDTLKDHSDFGEAKPKKPKSVEPPLKPNVADKRYAPKIGVLEFFIPSYKRAAIAAAEQLFNNETIAWEAAAKKADAGNRAALAQYAAVLAGWGKRREEYLETQARNNKSVEDKKEQYLKGDSDAIFDYCEMVLSNSQYPASFPKNFDLEYTKASKTLVVNYWLPTIEDLPKVKQVKYVASRDEMVETHLPESTINKLYDGVIYQICLRTVHELYEADVVGGLDSIVFNGWIDTIDKATGKETQLCVMSLQTIKKAFLDINLSNVDPKVCFKNLKGVGSSKLHSMTAVAPILNISREDKRFIDAYAVAKDLDSSTNLAAMDWEDFEHLIRELFEKEFKQSGGEVKVTQASRDAGVDAVAFDPDPIRGGKIVIQAKRYTNTVGVSAVRDLYGTVMNEGATKGILVTTADYGPDAYDFAKGKPLTLLNGANLLHLLEKHGHIAKIDLAEAKRLNSVE